MFICIFHSLTFTLLSQFFSPIHIFFSYCSFWCFKLLQVWCLKLSTFAKFIPATLSWKQPTFNSEQNQTSVFLFYFLVRHTNFENPVWQTLSPKLCSLCQHICILCFFFVAFFFAVSKCACRKKYITSKYYSCIPILVYYKIHVCKYNKSYDSFKTVATQIFLSLPKKEKCTRRENNSKSVL